MVFINGLQPIVSNFFSSIGKAWKEMCIRDSLYDLTAYHRVNKISVKVEGKGIKIV